jgi:ribonuclease HII
MEKLAKEFPEYSWEKNKGYPTKAHVDAVMKFGTTPFHRRTFHIKAYQLSLNF